MSKVIGVCGLIGCGKGTVADFIVSEAGYQKISFADALKDGVAAIFGWDRDMLEGDTVDSRAWREIPDDFWTKEIGQPVTPRLVLQLFGTECMRQGFHEDIWVNIVKKKILDNPDTNFVIPDARFKNEISMIKSFPDSEFWWVKRGELPEWWNVAVLTNITDAEQEYVIYDQGTHMEIAYPDIHPSEWSWANTNDYYDHIISNDDTATELLETVKSLLK